MAYIAASAQAANPPNPHAHIGHAVTLPAERAAIMKHAAAAAAKIFDRLMTAILYPAPLMW
jgi:hypothetical protein